MRPIVKKQNPDMNWRDIDQKLSEMWQVLTEEEQILYYVKELAIKDAWKVFEDKMEHILTKKINLAKNRIKVFHDYIGNAWCSLTKEEKKSYVDNATMLLTPEQVMKHMPGMYIDPQNIFFEEKGIAQKRGQEYDKFYHMWQNLKEEERKPYKENAKAKEIERYKHVNSIALKTLNDEKAKITKEQKLRRESIEHMENIKQKEHELLTREKHINTREKELILKEKQFNEREIELNKKEARLIKMEEYLNNLFLL